MVPPAKVLGPNQRICAFLGDKYLGAGFAKWIWQAGGYDQGTATQLASIVLSNKFMAERYMEILPYEEYRRSGVGRNEHSRATTIEAAVAAVDNDMATKNLVEYLIHAKLGKSSAKRGTSGVVKSGVRVLSKG
jgi:hypothetical protein